MNVVTLENFRNTRMLIWVLVLLGAALGCDKKNDPVPISISGKLWVWGANRFGQMGNGTIEDVDSPGPVLPEKNWKVVSVSYENIAGIQADGTIWA